MRFTQSFTYLFKTQDTSPKLLQRVETELRKMIDKWDEETKLLIGGVDIGVDYEDEEYINVQINSNKDIASEVGVIGEFIEQWIEEIAKEREGELQSTRDKINGWITRANKIATKPDCLISGAIKDYIKIIQDYMKMNCTVKNALILTDKGECFMHLHKALERKNYTKAKKIYDVIPTEALNALLLSSSTPELLRKILFT